MANIIKDQYFTWMVDRCHAQNRIKVMELLHMITFSYLLPMDGNRYEDGIELRYKFGNEFDIPSSTIARELDIYPCSVLEMMVALAIRCEESIMYDENEGDRTYKWFNEMLTNLGLIAMTDHGFHKQYCINAIYRFLNREYKPNGEGGLFVVENRGDLRKVEIWYQAMWYLTSLYSYA